MLNLIQIQKSKKSVFCFLLVYPSLVILITTAIYSFKGKHSIISVEYLDKMYEILQWFYLYPIVCSSSILLTGLFSGILILMALSFAAVFIRLLFTTILSAHLLTMIVFWGNPLFAIFRVFGYCSE